MTNPIPPFLIPIVGSLLIPLLKGKVKSIYLVIIPILTFFSILSLKEGFSCVYDFLNYEIILIRADALSLVFAYVFSIAFFLGNLYALHIKNDGEHISAMIYAGAALGAVFAGDLLTLFIFWEIMAISATYLVWSGRQKESYGAGMRYLCVHILGGLFLLVGIIMHVHQTGSLEFNHIGLTNLSSLLILIGFGINAGFPLLHAWIPDAYPQASFSGTVFLSVFTTKTAVYALARSFYGTDILIWIGVVMAIFPLFYALLENNLRRVLSYILINQVGFMVTGIGIGTSLALNGVLAHAFCHIIYESLIFMALGALIYQTGRINATDLGGLYKSMPLTTIFCVIGGLSISGFPLTSGFVSKSMIISASGKQGIILAFLALIFASAGVFLNSGLKIPYSAFFSDKKGIQAQDPPINMLMAMGIAAILSILIGTFPQLLYGILPHPVNYKPYTMSHIVGQLQIMGFTALAFVLLLRLNIYPVMTNSINIDADWFYRKGTKLFLWFIEKPGALIMERVNNILVDKITGFFIWFSGKPHLASRIMLDSFLLAFSIPEKRDELKKRLEAEKKLQIEDFNTPISIGNLVFLSLAFLLGFLLVFYF